MTVKIKLRKRKISGKRESLYLDIYPPIPHPTTGEPTRREFLKMYVFEKAKDVLDKKHNTETLRLAEQIRQNRENHLNKPEIYTGYEREQLKIKEQGEKNFVDYFKRMADSRKASNHDNWVSAFHYLNTFTKGTLKFSDINEKMLNEFKNFLLTSKSTRSDKTTLSHNSAVSYFNKVKAAMKQAYKDGFLSIDINSKIAPIKTEETHRNYLTIEELNTLIQTDCKNPLLKNAALFSALTGLRFSDIQKLTWREIENIKGKGYFIHFTQKKTKSVEVLPIPEQAVKMIGKRQNPEQKVFEGLKYSAYENKHLAKWIGLAGIEKDITFHCFRHTYATLQLSLGTDIYTVSKMLGHRELKTTQVYAKIMDQAKRDAANKIKLKF